MRILPHHQNTGGFFVAVISKTGAIPIHLCESRKEKKERLNQDNQSEENQSSEKKSSESAESTETSESKSGKEKKPKKHSREDPFMFLSGERWENAIKNIKFVLL